MNVIIVNQDADYPFLYDAALELAVGSILKCKSGDYAMVTRVIEPDGTSSKILVGLLNVPTVINPELGYTRFQKTDLNTLLLK